MLCVYGYVVAKKENFPKSFDQFSLGRVFKSLKGAIWALMMPLIILGGIYGGIFTPTESAMIACAYGLIVSFFVTKELTVRNFMDVVSKTAASTANVTVMFLAAQVFGFLLPTMISPPPLPTSLLRFLPTGLFSWGWSSFC